MANSTWKEVETSEQYQRAGTTLKCFLRLLWDFDQAIGRYKSGKNDAVTLNHLLSAIGYSLNKLEPQSKQAFFRPGGKRDRFHNLTDFLKKMERYQELNPNVPFLELYLQEEADPMLELEVMLNVAASDDDDEQEGEAE